MKNTSNAGSYAVPPGALINFTHLGISISAGFEDPEYGERPYVTINTEDLPACFRYDEATGLRGDAEPFSAEDAGDEWRVVRSWEDKREVIATFPGDGVTPRLDAKAYAEARNADWHKSCGMPIIAVHLNDSEVYNAEDHNPDLREEATR